jgi:SAM-dependent methyltransferase
MSILEKELLAKNFRRAKPVGLRYDRANGETAGRHFRCNAALISRLLARCTRVLVSCEEGWSREIPDVLTGEITRARLSPFPDVWTPGTRISPEGGAIQIETYAELPLDEDSFDGVVADSSLLLSGDVTASLREFRRILSPKGTLVVLGVNWEHEMAGKSVSYEISFRRYRDNAYLGLIRRTLSPPAEIEYVCLLDPHEELTKKLVCMNREELRSLSLEDVPAAREHVVSVELIQIPQMTAVSLREACEAAGFRDVVVRGFPHTDCGDAPHLLAVGKA